MQRDTVIGIVGVVILVAAMVGVFTYERGQFSATADPGDGTLTTLAGPGANGNVALGDTADSVLSINQTGITNLTFTLRWTATNGLDTLRMSVAPSNATGVTTGAQSEAEEDGEITLTVPVANTAGTGVLGVGDWQVTVEFVSARTGLPAEPPIPPPGTRDNAVGYTIETSLQTLAAPAA